MRGDVLPCPSGDAKVGREVLRYVRPATSQAPADDHAVREVSVNRRQFLKRIPMAAAGMAVAPAAVLAAESVEWPTIRRTIAFGGMIQGKTYGTIPIIYGETLNPGLAIWEASLREMSA